MIRWRVGLYLGFGVLVGCGSSHSDPAITATQECETFLDAYCGHGASCIVEDGLDPGSTEAQEKQACLDVAHQNVSCDRAVAVGPTYNSCLAQVKATDCAAFANASAGAAPPLPADCEGVIKVLQ